MLRYSRYFRDSVEKERWKIIFTLFEKEPSVFLDCGCGNGEITLNIMNIIKPERVLGIDLDDEKLKIAGERGIITYKANLEKVFPIPNDFVDVVFSNEVIEHLVDVDGFIGEIYRVLKPGGYAIVCTENLASWHNILALLMGNQPYSGPTASTKYLIGHHPTCELSTKSRILEENEERKFFQKHKTVFAFKAFRDIFEAFGFKIEKAVGIGYIPFPIIISRIFASLDPSHAYFITIKAKKPFE